ncbi:hypothetical protein K1719_036338, partial [Acacia pycnantha]
VSKPRRQRRGGKEKVAPAAQRPPGGSRFEVLVVDGCDVGGEQGRPSPDVSTGVLFKAKRESSGNEGVDKKWKVNKKQGRGKSRAGEKKMGEGNKSEKRTREDMRKGSKERKSLSINSEVSYGKKQVVSEVTGEQEGELMIVGPKVGSVAGDFCPDGGVFSSVQVDPGAEGVLNRIEGKFWNGPKALDPDDMWEEEAQAPNISLGVEDLGSIGDMGVAAHEMSEGGSFVPETQGPALFYLSKLGFDGSAFVPSIGRSGGLVAVWKKDHISVDVLRRERQFIHFRCSVPGKGVFFLTFVYAIPRSELKQSLWQELLSLSSSMSGSWVLAGDFNDILSADERTGGVGVNFSRIDLFQNRILSCDLSDLGFHGPKFTWRGPQSFNCSRLYERLDRALGNTNFLSEFSACSVQVKKHTFVRLRHICINQKQQLHSNMSNHFPLEIVEEILHRLPIKSIVKCTSVCKAWNSLITRQTFIYDHLNRTIQAPNHNSSLFFQFRKISPDDPHSLHQEETYSLYCSINQQTDQFSVERFPLSHLFEHNRCTLFVGACNGLVCSTDYSPLKSATIIIWNPSLRKYIVLPKPIMTRKIRSRQYLCSYVDPKHSSLFGFGFDSRNNDYKVVRLMNDRCTKDTPHVEVYSLASHIWRSISVTVPQFFLSDCQWFPSMFLNGALHWLVWRYAAYDEEGIGLNYRFILSFDVIQETFRELTLPQQQPFEKAFISRLLPVEGSHSLAVVNHVNMKSRSRCVFCIWVMKDYGNTNSWTEMFRLDSGLYGGIFTVLALTSSGKVVLRLTGGAIVLADPTKESEEPVGNAKMPQVFVSSFVESLLFLNKEPDVLSF